MAAEMRLFLRLGLLEEKFAAKTDAINRLYWNPLFHGDHTGFAGFNTGPTAQFQLGAAHVGRDSGREMSCQKTRSV